MTKRQYDEFQARREIQDCGWKLDQQDKICFNGGSETDRHFIAKAQVGWFLSQQGYRIGSEVEKKDGSAEADIIAYANGEPPFVVEVETGLTEETKSKKLEQFYHSTPFVEVHMLEVNNLPEDRAEQLEWVQSELGGEL